MVNIGIALTKKRQFHILTDKLTYERICNFVFYLGVFMIPFDNLVFAPSAGWAAISPMIFFLYVVMNLQRLKLKINEYHVFGLLILLMFMVLNFIRFKIDLPSLVDSVATLVLGLCTFFALKLFSDNSEEKAKKIIKILFVAYTISFVYGILSVLNIGAINSFMIKIEKRHYDRLSFTFTEPSFISMHLYGVILPVLLYFKKKYKNELLKLNVLFVLFVITSFVFKSSSRFMLDTVIIFGIWIFTKLDYTKWITYVFLLIIPIGLVTAYFVLPKILGDRINNIYKYGIYADASLGSRWFRINSCLIGYVKQPFNCLFGYGLSNSDIPFKLGYSDAYLQYTHPYKSEIDSLLNMFNSQLFCMPIRIINEFGLLAFIGVFIYLYSKEYRFLYFIIIYLYLQFDSYAFYTIWIYLYMVVSLRERRKDKNEYLFDYSFENME